MAQVPADEQTFLLDVSAGTGIDPRVLQVEQMLEGHPGDEPGYFNWLNIPTSTANYNRSPVVGTGPGGTAAFGSLQAGVQATILEEQKIGLGDERGKSIAQQISDIQHSGWAGSGYPDFVSQFQALYPGVPLGSAATTAKPGPSQAVASLIATGWVNDVWTLIKLYYLRVLEVVGGAVLILVSLFMLARGGVPSPL